MLLFLSAYIFGSLFEKKMLENLKRHCFLLNRISLVFRYRVRIRLVHKLQKFWFYPYFYRISWLFMFRSKERNEENIVMPNVHLGAGIGHQLANWMAAYRVHKIFGTLFLHIPLKEDFESFLALSELSSTSESSIQDKKVLRIPLFDLDNPSSLIRKILASKQGYCLRLEDDQFSIRFDEILEDLQNLSNSVGLIQEKDTTEIALHIRRGDIVSKGGVALKHFESRYLPNSYYIKVLKKVLIDVESECNICIYSQGKSNDFQEIINSFGQDICLKLDISAEEAFLDMVNADYLITSLSSFSYKAALFSSAKVYCPDTFWHIAPKEWVKINVNK